MYLNVLCRLTHEYALSHFLGHTTVKMLQRLMANVDIFGSMRKCFQSRQAFNVHPTTKHKEQDPLPDQLKAAHFVLERKFVTPDLTRSKVEKFGDPKKTHIPSSSIDAYNAGKRKVIENFERKKFSLYGISIEQNDSDKSENEEIALNERIYGTKQYANYYFFHPLVTLPPFS